MMDGGRNPNIAATSDYSCGPAGDHAIYPVRKIGESNWGKFRVLHVLDIAATNPVAASLGRISLAQDPAGKRT